MIRVHLLAALLSAGICGSAAAQTDRDLKNAAKTPDRILTYGMSYSHQRFSPLKQINRESVSRLAPAWSYSLDSDKGEESQPLVMNGVMYITSHDKTVALDAATGKELWKTMVVYPPETVKTVCCGIVNRGAALYEGKLFRTLLDGRVQALDAKTGKELWTVRSGDPKDGVAMTGAPLIANGVVIVGWRGPNSASAAISTAMTLRPASVCGGTTPFRGPANPAQTAGRTTQPRRAAAAPGPPAPTIPISISSIGARPIPRHGIRWSARVTISIRTAYLR